MLNECKKRIRVWWTNGLFTYSGLFFSVLGAGTEPGLPFVNILLNTFC